MSPRVEGWAREDLPVLGRILSDWVDETPWMPRLHTREEDAGFVRGLAESHIVRVVRIEGQPVGFLARKGSEIDALYLAALARGVGIGRALVEDAMGAAAHLELWTFAANTGALKFYKRLGFHEVDATDGAGNSEGLPDVRLEWRR